MINHAPGPDPQSNQRGVGQTPWRNANLVFLIPPPPGGAQMFCAAKIHPRPFIHFANYDHRRSTSDKSAREAISFARKAPTVVPRETETSSILRLILQALYCYHTVLQFYDATLCVCVCVCARICVSTRITYKDLLRRVVNMGRLRFKTKLFYYY